MGQGISQETQIFHPTEDALLDSNLYSAFTHQKENLNQRIILTKANPVDSGVILTGSYRSLWSRSPRIIGSYKMPISLLCKQQKNKILVNDEYISNVTKFTVITNPTDARIKFLNIDRTYQPNMIINHGEYQIEISKEGFKPLIKAIDLSNGLSKKVSVNLVKLSDILVSGNIIWKDDYKIKGFHKKYVPRKIDGTLFEVSKNKIWLDNWSVENIYRSWDDAKKYCNELSLGGVNNWTLPSPNDIANTDEPFKYQCGEKSYYPKCWSSKRNVAVDGERGIMHGTRDKASYSLGERVTVRCLANLSKVPSIEKLTLEIANETLKKKLPLPPKPEKGEYSQVDTLVKGEFETTSAFQERERKHKVSVIQVNEKVDRDYELALKKWKKHIVQVTENQKKLMHEALQKKDQVLLKALEEAVNIKYGSPIIKNVSYNADTQVFDFEICSKNFNRINVHEINPLKKANEIQGTCFTDLKSYPSELKRALFHNKVSIPVKLPYARKFKTILIDPTFKPTVEFEVVNTKLQFSGIKEIKDPEYLVEEKEYKAAYASIPKLKAFMQKYPKPPFKVKAEARISVIAKNNQRAKEKRIHLAKEQRIRNAKTAKEQAERNRKAKIARARGAREFATLGVCNVGSSVTHREHWSTTTSSGNIIADGLFGAATKEEFIIYYEGIVQEFVGDKVKVIINDYRIKQTRGGGWFQPQTGRSYEITKHADKYLGKIQFYNRNRCK